MHESPEARELSIADVLRYYGATSVPEGVGWRSMNCPFHGDSHASGRVNTELNAFKCHGCSVSGDAIKLIRQKENMTFGEAVGFARKVLGQGIGDVSRSVPQSKPRRPLGREKWKGLLD